MASLLMSSPTISVSHRLFRCRYSNSRDVVARSPSFFRPAPPPERPERACSQATKFIDTQRKCIFVVTWNQEGKKQPLIINWLVPDEENRCLWVPDRIMNPFLLKEWILLSFSVRSSRSSALPPSWISVKTTYVARGGCTYETKMAARNGKHSILTILRKVRDC